MKRTTTRVIKSVGLPNQVRLPYYVEQGDPSGVPVLLLHAIADSWHAFERMLPHLPGSIHAFALTQRGRGDASRPAAGYHPRDFAADLAAFMDALHLEVAVIVGGSSGGFVARRFAIDHPERALRLVLLGSPLPLRDKPGVMEVWDSTVSKLTDPIDPGFVRDFAESALAQPVSQAFFETLVQENLKVPARVWRATCEGLLDDDSLGKLDKIKAPPSFSGEIRMRCFPEAIRKRSRWLSRARGSWCILAPDTPSTGRSDRTQGVNTARRSSPKVVG